MDQISREQAEHLLTESYVIDSQVSQNRDLIRVVLRLSDERSLIYDYDTKMRKKTYFIEDVSLTLV